MNIALFLDGTWQDPESNTNIAQLWARAASHDSSGAAQEIRYTPGVGTGGSAWDRLTGGVFGSGLDDDIIEGYRFITERHHSDDDRIYLFGYSRGAFTARSLAGVIAKCGIIAPDVLPAEEVFARYRRGEESPGLREMQTGEEPARTAEDRLLLERSRLVRIRFIGVFDTVGSLGIPGGIGRWLSRGRYQFHDTSLSGLVDHARHAVALDEHRSQLAPTLWTDVPIPVGDHTTQVDQRWFVGSHSNIGGGGTAQPDVDNPLSVLTLQWMAEQAVDAGLSLRPPMVPPEGNEWRGPIRRSRSGISRFLPWNTCHLRPVRTSIRETLDGSVLLRWGTGEPPYHPGNPNLAPWVGELTGQ